MKVFVSGGQFFADGFTVRGGFTMEEGEERFVSYIAESACGSGAVKVQNGELTATGSLVVIRRKQGTELRALPSPLPQCAEERLRLGDKVCRVACHPAPRSVITVTGDYSAAFYAKTHIFAPTLKRIDGQKDALMEVRAQCAEGSFIAILSFGEGVSLLMQEAGQSVLCHGNEITVKKTYPDLCGREVTTTYLWRGRDFTSSRTITYANDPAPMKEAMGRLLLEGVIAKDEDAVKRLLSPEIADARAVFDYFGEIAAVENPFLGSSPTAVCALTKQQDGFNAVTYDFDFDGSGRITNIRRPEED